MISEHLREVSIALILYWIKIRTRLLYCSIQSGIKPYALCSVFSGTDRLIVFCYIYILDYLQLFSYECIGTECEGFGIIAI